MGIKHFFSWFKKHFLSSIHYVNNDLKTEAKVTGIDNLIIDMNGIFHTSAQKIYEYGSFKPNTRLLGVRKNQKQGGITKQVECYKDVCKTLDEIVDIVKPNKRVILCVDGPAPLSKQDQQRKRRFMSSLDRENSQQSFDSNSITPGTKFMHFLTKYIDWHLRKKISENDPNWSRIEVIFSNEKAPGEGEHKGINFIRKLGSKNDSYCIFGMDADLIMLALGTHIPNFYILREEPMSSNFKYYLIDIKTVREQLGHIMKWEGKKEYDLENAIDDFIFMCFTVGNDFLPHFPAVNIRTGGVDKMLNAYKATVGNTDDNLTDGKTIYWNNVRKVIKFLAALEEEYIIAEHKSRNFKEKRDMPQNSPEEKIKRFDLTPMYDREAEKYINPVKPYWQSRYYRALFDIKSDTDDDQKKDIAINYLQGLEWTMKYYTSGCPDWRWRYKYSYPPLLQDLIKHVPVFSCEFVPVKPPSPVAELVQLCYVLPRDNLNLLPPKLVTELLAKHDDWYKSNCEFVWAYCRYFWESHVEMNEIDIDELEEFIRSNKALLEH